MVSITIEHNGTLDGDGEYIVHHVNTLQISDVAVNARGCILYNMLRAAISTNGGLVYQTRFEYNFYSRKLHLPDNKL